MRKRYLFRRLATTVVVLFVLSCASIFAQTTEQKGAAQSPPAPVSQEDLRKVTEEMRKVIQEAQKRSDEKIALERALAEKEREKAQATAEEERVKLLDESAQKEKLYREATAKREAEQKKAEEARAKAYVRNTVIGLVMFATLFVTVVAFLVHKNRRDKALMEEVKLSGSERESAVAENLQEFKVTVDELKVLVQEAKIPVVETTPTPTKEPELLRDPDKDALKEYSAKHGNVKRFNIVITFPKYGKELVCEVELRGEQRIDPLVRYPGDNTGVTWDGRKQRGDYLLRKELEIEDVSKGHSQVN